MSCIKYANRSNELLFKIYFLFHTFVIYGVHIVESFFVFVLKFNSTYSQSWRCCSILQKVVPVLDARQNHCAVIDFLCCENEAVVNIQRRLKKVYGDDVDRSTVRVITCRRALTSLLIHLASSVNHAKTLTWEQMYNELRHADCTNYTASVADRAC